MREPRPPHAEIHEMQPLSGKVAVVTGTSRGIGAEIARSLAGAGVIVVGNHVDPGKAIRQDRILTEIAEAGGSFSSILADITEPEGRSNLLRSAINSDVQEEPRGVDFLILNAAGGLEQGKPNNWAHTINVDAQLALVDDFVPHMNPGGKIIYLTSLWAHRFGEVKLLPGYRPVAKTKHEAEQRLRGRQDELAERGISLGILSGHVIKGTAAYTLLSRYYKERVATLEQLAEGGTFPEASDMAAAVRDMLLMPFESGYTHYVGGTQAEPLEQRRAQTFNRREIAKLLPMYGDGKLLVDQFTINEDGESGVGRYTVRPEDVNGHFSGEEYEDVQVFRGVDQIEAAAQAFGLTLLLGESGQEESLGFFRRVGETSFDHMIFPGDTIEMKVRATGQSAQEFVGECEMTVIGQAEPASTITGISLTIVPKQLVRLLVSREKSLRQKS